MFPFFLDWVSLRRYPSIPCTASDRRVCLAVAHPLLVIQLSLEAAKLPPVMMLLSSFHSSKEFTPSISTAPPSAAVIKITSRLDRHP